MSIDFFNSERILRLTPIGNDTESVADKILEGDFRIFPKLPNVTVPYVDELWEMKFELAPSTYALYVYALYPVSYLLNAYELTGRVKYLDHATEFVKSFFAWEKQKDKRINEKRFNILYGDHSYSNRTQVLCYLACCLKNERRAIGSELRAALLVCGNYLSDIDNYSHYNHGLMMDLALTGLINVLGGLGVEYPIRCKEQLLDRLQYSVFRDLTDDGVHVENSPGYHFWMLGFLSRLMPALEYLDHDLFDKLRSVVRKAKLYAAYITRPDGSVPPIGDTHANMKSLPSTGLSTKYFKDADQVVFRDADDLVWAHFSSGYRTHVHKHADNGSFNLWHQGRDIFIDPGFLNYENDNDSILIRSAAFHNTVAPSGEDQNIRSIDLSQKSLNYRRRLSPSRIVGFVYGREYESALAKIADYESTEFDRLLLWCKPNIFVIYDRASVAESTFQQTFHLATGLFVEAEANNQVTVLCSETGDHLCKLSQHALEGSGSHCELVIAETFSAEQMGSRLSSKSIVSRIDNGKTLTIIELLSNSQSDTNIEVSENLKLRISSKFEYYEIDLETFAGRIAGKKLQSTNLYDIAYLCDWQFSSISAESVPEVKGCISDSVSISKEEFVSTEVEENPFIRIFLPNGFEKIDARFRFRDLQPEDSPCLHISLYDADGMLLRSFSCDVCESEKYVRYACACEKKAVHEILIERTGVCSISLNEASISVCGHELVRKSRVNKASRICFADGHFFGLGGRLSVYASAILHSAIDRKRFVYLDKAAEHLIAFPLNVVQSRCGLDGFLAKHASKSIQAAIAGKRAAYKKATVANQHKPGMPIRLRDLESRFRYISRNALSRLRFSGESDLNVIRRAFKKLLPSDRVLNRVEEIESRFSLGRNYANSVAIHFRHGNGERYWSRDTGLWGVKPACKEELERGINEVFEAAAVSEVILATDCLAVAEAVQVLLPKKCSLYFLDYNVQQIGAGCSHYSGVFDAESARLPVDKVQEEVDSFAQILVLSKCNYLLGGRSYFFEAVKAFSRAEECNIFHINNDGRYAHVPGGFLPVCEASGPAAGRILSALRKKGIRVDGVFLGQSKDGACLTYFDQVLIPWTDVGAMEELIYGDLATRLFALRFY